MKPIIFSTPMVQAILDGRKTQTRRVIEFPEGMTGRLPESGARDYLYYPGGIKRPPYQPGDIFWMKETFFEHTGKYYYKADGKHEELDSLIGGSFFKWQSPVCMPKEAARLFLLVKNVSVERLQDITEEDAKAEGVDLNFGAKNPNVCKWQNYRDAYHALWDSLNAKRGFPFESNPCVWKIEFERVEIPY